MYRSGQVEHHARVGSWRDRVNIVKKHNTASEKLPQEYAGICRNGQDISSCSKDLVCPFHLDSQSDIFFYSSL